VIGADRGSAAALAPPRPECSNRPTSLDARSGSHTPRRWLMSCGTGGTAGTGKPFPRCCTCLRVSCTFPFITVARALLARALPRRMARRRSPPILRDCSGVDTAAAPGST
jgi:hypothetical protein